MSSEDTQKDRHIPIVLETTSEPGNTLPETPPSDSSSTSQAPTNQTNQTTTPTNQTTTTTDHDSPNQPGRGDVGGGGDGRLPVGPHHPSTNPVGTSRLSHGTNSTSKTFSNVTQAVFDRVKSDSLKEHGTQYSPPHGNHGTAVTHVTAVGTIKLSFDFNPQSHQLTYTIEDKPWIVSADQIWDGIQKAIDKARKEQ